MSFDTFASLDLGAFGVSVDAVAASQTIALSAPPRNAGYAEEDSATGVPRDFENTQPGSLSFYCIIS
jgi:hypothetical protein